MTDKWPLISLFSSGEADAETNDMTQYENFRELTDETYPHCTLTEKLEVYIQHRPRAVVPFLEELIRQLKWEKQDERDTKSD